MNFLFVDRSPNGRRPGEFVPTETCFASIFFVQLTFIRHAGHIVAIGLSAFSRSRIYEALA